MPQLEERILYHDIENYRFQCEYSELNIIKIWELLVKNHSTLATSFDFSEYSEPLQLVHYNFELPIKFIDIRGQSIFQRGNSSKYSIFFSAFCLHLLHLRQNCL